MRSSVENFMNYQDISVPEDTLTVEIPSWEAIAQPLIDHAKRQYEELVNEPVTELTDDMVTALSLPGITSVSQLKQYGMDLYQQKQVEYQFYNHVLPFILNYYAQNTNVIINSDELLAYEQTYLERIENYATQYQMSLSSYAQEMLNINGDIEETLKERAREDFIFKLVAHKVFDMQGGSLDEEAYEVFIQSNVLNSGADEIELRERFPYVAFMEMMPEMSLSQDIYDFFSQKITFKINPEASLRL